MTIMLLTASAWGWEPPVGSPMANSEHPRILFITDSHRAANPSAPGMTVQEMRTQLSSDSYSAVFASYIAALESTFSIDITTRLKMDTTFGAINYAFLYKLDPDNWVGSGFTFGYTTAEYGAKAKAYGDYIAQKAAAVLPTDQIKSNWSDYKTINYGGGDYLGDGATNISMAIVADWCPSLFTKADKQAYMDGFKAIFDYAGGLDGLDINIFSSAHHYGVSQNCGGIFAFYGEDIDDAPSTKYANYMADFGTKFYTDWLIALKEMDILAYEGGSNDFQGPIYGKVGANNMATFVSVMSTSLNENFFQTDPYWSEHGDYDLYTIKPLKYDGLLHDILTGDSGDRSAEIDMYYGINELYWSAVIKNAVGDNQRIARWTRDTYYTTNTSTRYDYRGVFAYFFNGYADVIPLSPKDANHPLSARLGRGQYQMYSDWEDTRASNITFLAPQWMAQWGGHVHLDFASFNIFKLGNLTEDRQQAKGHPFGGAKKYETQKSMFRNTIGVLDPLDVGRDDFNYMGYRLNYSSMAKTPNAPEYQPGGINNVGIVRADELDGVKYDYIDYDYSMAWDHAKVDYAEREFTYLRSAGGTDDEYVVVFDRINSTDASFQKQSMLQCMSEPEVINGGTQTSEKYPQANIDDGGRWVFPESSSDTVIKITNTYDTGHGVLMSRSLLPSEFQHVKIGGPDHYWEDAIGNTLPLVPPDIFNPLTTEYPPDIFNDYGTHVIRTTATVPANYDTFLNVMQVGDSNTLTTMTDIVKITAITGSTGNLVGAHIKDATKNRIILFNDQKRDDVERQLAPYVYTATVTAASHHLLTNIEPSSSFSVSDGTTTVATVASSVDGVMSFEDTTNTAGVTQYTVTKTGSVISLGFATATGQTVISPTFTITGTAVATTGKTITGVSSTGLTVTPTDGTWDELTEDFTTTVTLSEGVNILTFTATEDGGTAESDLTVTYSVPASDEVSLTVNQVDQTVPYTTVYIDVTGTTSYATTVSCSPEALNTGTVASYDFHQMLAVGDNVITVTASDGEDTVVKTITVTRSPESSAAYQVSGGTISGIN